MFPLVSEAASRVMPLDKLRWITFGHVESDESGSMNEWLAAAPRAEVAHGELGCMVSVSDLADRPPRPLADGEVIDLGGKRVRQLDHAARPARLGGAGASTRRPRGRCSAVTSAPSWGTGPPSRPTTSSKAADAAEDMFQSSSITAATAPTIRRMAALEPTTLAIMHGSSFSGDGGAVLRAIADSYERRLQQSMASV